MKRKTLVSLIALPSAALLVVAILAMMTMNPAAHIITAVSHASYQDMTVEEVVKEGDIIAIGEVKEVRPSYSVNLNNNPDLEEVLTDVVFSIEKELTGNYNGKEIVITTFGGTMQKQVDGKTVTMQAIAHDGDAIPVGKKVLLVLWKNPSDTELGGKYFVVGDPQGKFVYGEDGKLQNDKFFPGGESEDIVISRINGAREAS